MSKVRSFFSWEEMGILGEMGMGGNTKQRMEVLDATVNAIIRQADNLKAGIEYRKLLESKEETTPCQ